MYQYFKMEHSVDGASLTKAKLS